MAIVVPRRIPHLRKPEGPVEIDWGKVPTSLKAAWIFNEGGGSPIDLIDRRLAELQSSEWGVEEAGRGIIHDTTTDKTQLAADATNILPTGAITLLFGYQKRDSTNRQSGAFGIAANVSGQSCGAHHPWSDGKTYWDYGGQSGANRVSATLPGFQQPRGYAFTSGPRGMEIWQDGIRKASNANNATRTETSEPFKLGDHDGNPSDFVNFYYFYIFHEQLPEASISRWTESVDSIYRTLKPRRRWVPVVIQGGATVSVGLATELSTALAISRRKQKAVGLSAETDTALATTPAKVTAIGLSTEIDTAFSILRSKIKTTGLSNETDSAFALIISSAVNVGLSDETDSALAISRLKQNPVGLSTETDSALSIGRSKIKIAGLGIETDVAFTTTWEKLKSVGLSSELDEALAISSSGSLAVGLASELDVALVIGRLKQQALGIPTETDTSQPVGKIKTQQAGLSVESDTALDVTSSSGRVVGLATETDLAQSISRIKKKLIGLAPETDVALAVTIAGVTVVINTSAKETLKLLAENPTLTLSAENATLTLT